MPMHPAWLKYNAVLTVQTILTLTAVATEEKHILHIPSCIEYLACGEGQYLDSQIWKICGFLRYTVPVIFVD